jgi:three-Cys-motif partner protein
MSTGSFFEKQTEPSRVKARIVTKYFGGWGRVMAHQNIEQIGYLDLFAGPGRYDDGKPSTPLLVLNEAVNYPKICNKIQLFFNDFDADNVKKLKTEIEAFPGVEGLRFEPIIENFTVGEATAAAMEKLKRMRSIPMLSFVDPWGYKGLSLPLIRDLVKNWGCDSIFFFNYRRINAAVDNIVLEGPVSIVFTEKILAELRRAVKGKKPAEREDMILAKIGEVFAGWGMKFFLSFRFRNETGHRTTHHLMFVTKNDLGCDIMKEIIAKESAEFIQGVPSFEYNPHIRQESLKQAPLPGLGPLDELKKSLLGEFAGKTVAMIDIYRRHRMSRQYLKKNYKAALLDLEADGRIGTDRTSRGTKKNSFPDGMLVSFPAR